MIPVQGIVSKEKLEGTSRYGHPPVAHQHRQLGQPVYVPQMGANPASRQPFSSGQQQQ
jgi:hypothetical protein